MLPPSSPDAVQEFLRLVGIEAHVVEEDGQNLIAISTTQFTQRRDWIERWFMLIVQTGDTTYLRERPRGTGDTR
jgi:hypothetical protein